MPQPNPTFPARIIIDDREQLPFGFANITARAADGGGLWHIPTVVKKLETGDYSIEGFEDRVAIERKSPEDIYKSISQDRGRFEREVSRLNCFEGYAAIVIEADLYELVTNKPEYVTTPSQVLAGTFVSWTLEYPSVDWHFFRTRRLAEIMTFRFLHSWLEKQMEEEKEHHLVRQKRGKKRKAMAQQESYTGEEVQFMKAADRLKRKLRRYPNFAEVLEMAKQLGWRHFPALAKSEAETRVENADQP